MRSNLGELSFVLVLGLLLCPVALAQCPGSVPGRSGRADGSLATSPIQQLVESGHFLGPRGAMSCEPSSVARGVSGGAAHIESMDRLVSRIAAQKGMRCEAVDESLRF